MNQYATAAEIATLFGWSEAYVRRLASKHEWKRRGRAPTQYRLTDVVDTRQEQAARRARP